MMDSNRGKTVLISSTKGEQFHMNAGEFPTNNFMMIKFQNSRIRFLIVCTLYILVFIKLRSISGYPGSFQQLLLTIQDEYVFYNQTITHSLFQVWRACLDVCAPLGKFSLLKTTLPRTLCQQPSSSSLLVPGRSSLKQSSTLLMDLSGTVDRSVTFNYLSLLIISRIR